MMVMPEFQHKSGEAQSPEKPVFDGGAFTIEFLSSNPAGFEVRTEKTLLPYPCRLLLTQSL